MPMEMMPDTVLQARSLAADMQHLLASTRASIAAGAALVDVYTGRVDKRFQAAMLDSLLGLLRQLSRAQWRVQSIMTTFDPEGNARSKEEELLPRRPSPPVRPDTPGPDQERDRPTTE